MVVGKLKHMSAVVEVEMLSIWVACGTGERGARRHR